MVWTQFWDMHSGGGCKEPPYEQIYIEAPEAEAKVIFYNRFGHNPERVSCTCCGDDYSISESQTLEQATGYQRGCEYGYMDSAGVEVPEGVAWKQGVGILPGYSGGYLERPRAGYGGDKYMTLAQYECKKDVLIIRAADIKDGERVGEVRRQGYVWCE